MLDEHHAFPNSIPAGTSDCGSSDMCNRQYALSIIEDVYRHFGFDPLQTPTLEHEEVFRGHHGVGEKLQFRFIDSLGRPLVLRYDLTVPLARYVTQHPDLPLPFKRYQIGAVFRDDTVDRGHYREFTQCDGDSIGASALSTDADIIRLAYAGLSRLHFPAFTIRISHRMIIAGIAHKVDLHGSEGRLMIQRAMDHADKVTKDGMTGVRRDLKSQGLSSAAIETIIQLLNLAGTIDEKINALENLLKNEPEGMQGIAELREIVSYLAPEIMENVELDLSLARGADYYTGLILEGVIPGIKVGAVLGGGRYDHLVRDLGGPDLPSIGMAFGLERIMVAMTDLNLWTFKEKPRRILVCPLCGEDERRFFDIAGALRDKGVCTDYVPLLGKDENTAIHYAQRRGFTHIVVNEAQACTPQAIV